jgi:predicted ATPase/class 3 adenylate cyclase
MRQAILYAMQALPQGTVTFVFTDIEGSTRLLRELGEGYIRALADHRRVLRDAFSARGGIEVDTQGDGTFFVFPGAADAVAAAAAAQAGLASGPIRVRMGLHTGDAVLTDEGYVGMDVHRAARIAAAAHGGQVVVSAATRELAGGAGLTDLGEHRLKDLSAPERLYQLGDGAFPGLKTLGKTNLPVPATTFLGRERELAEVLELARGRGRLLTLTGPGGTGKTRLALQAAAELGDDYEDGVFWVQLAPLPDADLVLEVAAQTLGARGELAAHIAQRRLLLVLDNFEHVIAAAPKVSELLESCPRLSLLVTSRERLAIAGEQEYPVPTLGDRDGVTLFVDRARALDPGFVADDAVAELCARLDHLPLALELAAARIKLFSPERLLGRLGERLDLLKGGRDADPRQQTLRTTIEWSHGLLNERERRAFARLSVFAGGWLLEDAEAVCEADVDTLGSLVDKSLVTSRGDRFSMLETIRHFAAEKLAEAGDADAIRLRHAEHFAVLACRLSEPARHSDEDALARLDDEHDNMRTALRLAVDDGDLDLGQRLIEGLWFFWITSGYTAEGDRWVRQLLMCSSEQADPQLLSLAGELARFAGDLERAVRLKERAISLFEAKGERRTARDDDNFASVLTDLAETLIALGDLERAQAEAERALAIRVESGEPWGMAHARDALVRLEISRGDFARAAALAEESLLEWRTTQRWSDIAQELFYAASAHRRAGNAERAEPLLREGLALAAEIEDWAVTVECLEEAAAAELARGRPERARALLAAVRAWREESGFSWSLDDDVPRVHDVDGAPMSLRKAVAYALGD